MATGAQTELTRDRGELLRSLTDYKEEPNADPADSERALARRLRLVLAGARDAQQRKFMTNEQSAWLAYRTAEIALASHVLGKQHNPAVVTRDVTTRLINVRVNELARR